MKKGTVLCVEDDAQLQLVMEQYLEDNGYNVLTANNVENASKIIGTTNLDVVLLDLTLPDGEGLSLIPIFRSQTKAGIIVVSGKSETTEKIVCLEMGADDYLTKPFEMRELSARIKAVLRRMEPVPAQNNVPKQHADVIKFNKGWTLDRTKYQAYTPDNRSADLTTGEFELLEALVNAHNRALTREHLFDLTRNGKFDIYDRAIDIQISRIRKKIGDEDQSLIKTVRGVGYMFCGTLDAA